MDRRQRLLEASRAFQALADTAKTANEAIQKYCELAGDASRKFKELAKVTAQRAQAQQVLAQRLEELAKAGKWDEYLAELKARFPAEDA